MLADVTGVLQRLPPVPLTGDTAARLQAALDLRSHLEGTAIDLKEIIQQCMFEKQNFSVSDLVLGLLLTQPLGRCVTLLLPYCKLHMAASGLCSSVSRTYLYSGCGFAIFHNI